MWASVIADDKLVTGTLTHADRKNHIQPYESFNIHLHSQTNTTNTDADTRVQEDILRELRSFKTKSP